MSGLDNPGFCKEGSECLSAKLFPLKQSHRQLAMFDPKTMEYTFVDICFDTHHLEFGFDKDDTLWRPLTCEEPTDRRTMPLWKPTHQFSKSLRDFLHKIPGLVVGASGSPPPAPRVPFVIRLGAAGPLDLGGAGEHLSSAIGAILSALKEYAKSANPRFHRMVFADGTPPPAQLRLISQLAAGFDQLAASTALAAGYKLHVVLPGTRTAFRQDIERNLPSEGSAAAQELRLMGFDAGGAEREESRPPEPPRRFEQLVEAADRVLELDRDDASSDQSPFHHRDYEQAGWIILDHSDLVLVVVHDEPDPALGGTRWIEQRAEEKRLAIIRVPSTQPLAAMLTWTVDGRREQRRLFTADPAVSNPCNCTVDAGVFAAALDDQLLGPSFDLTKTRPGWLERRMIAQLDPAYNAREWDKRWQLGSLEPLLRHDLGLAPQQIDADLKAAKVWADYRASAMAELVRGSFIVAALVGVLAVLGALIGIIFHVLSVWGKLAEILCLLLIFWLIRRSRRVDWRSQWLSLRQLERFVEQAAWLLLLGRGRIYPTPSHLARFQTDHVALWTNAYFRGVIRSCSFPTVRFAPDYLNTVHALALRNLVTEQISYLEGEVHFQQKSDEVLESWTKGCVSVAFVVTLAYLIYRFADSFLLPGLQMEHVLGETAPRRVVSVLGALLTAAAAALAAMRSHGEYAQIAARYEGTCEALREIQSQLTARLPDHQLDFSPPPLRSATLAAIIRQATDDLVQEVQGWRAILQKKEIEPT
jgi:hypothetical protein